MENEKVKLALSKLQSIFQSGDILPIISSRLIARSGKDRPCHLWSLRNQILVAIEGTDDARGIRQWNKVNRYVTGGTHGFPILVPMRGEDEEGNPYTYYWGKTVHPIEHTEGEPVEYPCYDPPVWPPLYERMLELGFKIEYIPYTPGSHGSYRQSNKTLYLKTHDDETFFHEAGHALHSLIEPLKGGQDSFQEVVAETVAGVLCILYGQDTWLGNVQQYIDHYNNSHVSPTKVITTVEKVFTFLYPQTAIQPTEERLAA